MLASTVQFSNNDQSHTLNDPKTTSSEAGNHEATSVPSGPNNVPDTVNPRSRSTPKQY